MQAARHRLMEKNLPLALAPLSIGASNHGQGDAKAGAVLPLSSPPKLDLSQINAKLSTAENLAADSRAQLLAAEGKANSNNCRLAASKSFCGVNSHVGM